jgi:hypothetical protein
MEEEGGGASGSEDEVVQLEDAVELLVEHLVVPVLPRGQVDREVALSPATQETVARQVRKLLCLTHCSFSSVGCDAVARGGVSWRGRSELRNGRSMGLAPPPRAIRFGCGFGSRGVLRACGIRNSRLLRVDL